MRLRLFRAESVADAMRQVRSELGSDALILSTRRVGDGFEVTAALEPRVDEEDLAPLPADPRRAAALEWHAVPATIAARLQAGPLPFALSAALRFQKVTLEPQSNPLLLVGPPGAGKTLTAARLATRSVMAGVAPLMITADGRRAGAIEQLAAFTRLLGVNLLVASTPSSLRRAMARRNDGAPVLIDAPGCDPFDAAQRDEVAALAAASGATIALVLAAGVDASEANDIASAYSEAGATLLVATRLDLARRLGGVLAAAVTGLAMIEAGVGPGAADGMVPMTPELLAGRLMQVPGRRQAIKLINRREAAGRPTATGRPERRP